jgi:hypothetical protein
LIQSSRHRNCGGEQNNEEEKERQKERGEERLGIRVVRGEQMQFNLIKLLPNLSSEDLICSGRQRQQQQSEGNEMKAGTGGREKRNRIEK